MNLTHQERFIGIFRRLEGLEMQNAPIKQLKLSMPQIALMRCLARMPGSHAQEVAEAMGLTAPTISVSLRKLEEEGWLHREPDPDDGRAMRHYLTEKALEAIEAVKQFRQDKVAEFLTSLTTTEQEQLLALLEKALSRLETKQRELP